MLKGGKSKGVEVGVLEQKALILKIAAAFGVI